MTKGETNFIAEAFARYSAFPRRRAVANDPCETTLVLECGHKIFPSNTKRLDPEIGDLYFRCRECYEAGLTKAGRLIDD
jgi:hypothetical protein